MNKKSKCFTGFNAKVNYALRHDRRYFNPDLMDYYLDILAQIAESNMDGEDLFDTKNLLKYISCCFHNVDESIDMIEARRDLNIDKIIDKYEK